MSETWGSQLSSMRPGDLMCETLGSQVRDLGISSVRRGDLKYETWQRSSEVLPSVAGNT